MVWLAPAFRGRPYKLDRSGTFFLPPSIQSMSAGKTTKLSSGEKASLKKVKAKDNKAKANPALAAANKQSADAKRARRKESGSTKVFK